MTFVAVSTKSAILSYLPTATVLRTEDGICWISTSIRGCPQWFVLAERRPRECSQEPGELGFCPVVPTDPELLHAGVLVTVIFVPLGGVTAELAVGYQHAMSRG
jgi:hypothetical protein